MLFLGNDFYFSRHGETDYNARGVVTGVRDIPLNACGVEQARSAAQLVKELGITACFTSPLIRAVQTAELMFDGNAVAITPVSALYERHWGELEGISKTKLDDYSFAEKNVEGWEAFCERTIAALKGIQMKVPVLIVAHSGTFRVLCEYLEINIKKEPVRNVRPYRFYKEGSVWSVTIL